VNVLLLMVDCCILPLFIHVRSVEFEGFLVQPSGQSIHEGVNGLWYIEAIAGHSDQFFKFCNISINVFPFHFDAFSQYSGATDCFMNPTFVKQMKLGM